MVLLLAILLLLALYLFLVMPSLRRHPDRKTLDGLKIAHRGFHNNAIPENSLSAFAEAVARGYAVENDIHITADGEIVVFHDNTLERMCGVPKKIEELTLNEIKQYNLKNTDEKIPTLKECLNLIDGKVPLVIEFKSSTVKCDKLCSKANEILEKYNGIYVIQSFNPAVVAWYKRNNKRIMRGILASVSKKKVFVAKLTEKFIFNFGARPDFVSYDINCSGKIAFVIQKLLGAFPVGWTIKNEKQYEKNKNRVKAYIFENFEL